jgi:hypothetical protein
MSVACCAANSKGVVPPIPRELCRACRLGWGGVEGVGGEEAYFLL